MARLYADENFPLPVVEELRRLGHDVVTLQETGKGGQVMSDQQVLEAASADGRAILTLNRKHFVHLHTAAARHGGVIVCTLDLDFTGQAARIDAALRGEAEFEGRLMRVNRPG